MAADAVVQHLSHINKNIIIHKLSTLTLNIAALLLFNTRNLRHCIFISA